VIESVLAELLATAILFALGVSLLWVPWVKRLYLDFWAARFPGAEEALREVYHLEMEHPERLRRLLGTVSFFWDVPQMARNQHRAELSAKTRTAKRKVDELMDQHVWSIEDREERYSTLTVLTMITAAKIEKNLGADRSTSVQQALQSIFGGRINELPPFMSWLKHWTDEAGTPLTVHQFRKVLCFKCWTTYEDHDPQCSRVPGFTGINEVDPPA
jgi:hypothetical protein